MPKRPAIQLSQTLPLLKKVIKIFIENGVKFSSLKLFPLFSEELEKTCIANMSKPFKIAPIWTVSGISQIGIILLQ